APPRRDESSRTPTGKGSSPPQQSDRGSVANASAIRPDPEEPPPPLDNDPEARSTPGLARRREHHSTRRRPRDQPRRSRLQREISSSTRHARRTRSSRSRTGRPRQAHHFGMSSRARRASPRVAGGRSTESRRAP